LTATGFVHTPREPELLLPSYDTRAARWQHVAISGSRHPGVCDPQPAFVFAGHQFEADPQLRLCKSMLLDLFRGRIVEGINLKVSTIYGWCCESALGSLAH